MLALQGYLNAVLFAVQGIAPFFLMFGLWFKAALFAGAAVLSTVAPLLGRVAMVGVWLMLALMTFPMLRSILVSGLSWAHLAPVYVAAGLVGAFILPSGPIPPSEGLPLNP